MQTIAVKEFAVLFLVFSANFQKTFDRNFLIDANQRINPGYDRIRIDLILLDELDVQTE